MKSKMRMIIVVCAWLIICALIAAAITFSLWYVREDREDSVPGLGDVRDGWTPGNYSDLWDYNFSFTHGTTFNVTVENYTLYGYPIKQNIVLDVRGKNPSLHIYGGAAVTRDEKVKVYNDGTVRQRWVVSGMEPNETYVLVFFGEGQCGRMQEAW